MKGKCKDCKLWQSPEIGDGDFGRCNGIPFKEPAELAYVIDYEGYSASIRTKAEFGCALFVIRAEQEQ